MSSPSPSKIAKNLERLINSRKPNALVERFIGWALTNYVTAENLENAINQNIDILAVSLNEFHLGSPLVAPLFKLALQMFFTEFVENYLADAPKVYAVLAQKPEVAEILRTDRGVDYINRCCKATYQSLYDFCWSEYPTET